MLSSVSAHLSEYERPKRKALSRTFPILVPYILFTRRTLQSTTNLLTLKKLRKKEPLEYIIARHSSPLYRKLGDSEERLQIQKVTNLKIAIEKLNGIVIPPGEVFSFWHVLGSVTARKGYVPGMLLSNGLVSEGIGGGLCQLSNFLFWIFLHSDIEIVQRYHHSVDAFPDSGRTLPFGSGATIFSNFLDLRIRNTSKHPIQIAIWLTDSALKGQLRSSAPEPRKFHLFERNHCFVYKAGRYYRYNEIYRETYESGVCIKEDHIVTNFAPVIYPVSTEYLQEKKYQVFDLS